MISKEEKTALVKMFCAYCRRTLRNAKTDLMREEARRSRKETLFSDMRESELNRLSLPSPFCEEVTFEVLGQEIVVLGTELAEAIGSLTREERTAILLYYFAGWTDRQIAEELGCPRSTVQFRRARALAALRAYFGEGASLHDYL